MENCLGQGVPDKWQQDDKERVRMANPLATVDGNHRVYDKRSALIVQPLKEEHVLVTGLGPSTVALALNVIC